MTGFYRNVFSYYRGSAQREQDREKQLEDNTTKALVNTLENSAPLVTSEFLKWLGISAHGGTSFALQKPTIGGGRVSRKKQRLLLAIVGTSNENNASICQQLPAEANGDSRPDAWLYGEDFVVLLESKIGDSNLELNQMACHWHKLHPTSWKIVTWADIHRFFVTLTPRIKESRSGWLIEQLTQYLEWTGMTEFVGFKEEMFEFFVTPEKDPDAKRWVRGAVEGLADKLLHGKQGLRQFNKFYVDKHVGNLGKEADHYWAAFGPPNFRKSVHQTVSLYEQELYVFVNVELLPVINKLRKRIRCGAGFRKLMCDLPAPYVVRISERKPTNRPRHFDYNRLAEVRTDNYNGTRYGLEDCQSPGFEYIEKLLLDIKYPDLTVGRSFSRQEVLELSKPNGQKLVAEVLKTMKGLHPLVEFINNG